MQHIDLATWPRRAHYDFFRRFDQPHFGACAPVDVTRLLAFTRAHGLSFTHALVYLLTRTANALPDFRYRLRGDEVVLHDRVHPSLTVLGEEDLFGFCDLAYMPDFDVFSRDAAARMAAAREAPTLETNAANDAVLYMTAIPWVAFTSFRHPMHRQATDSVPRFAWGRRYPDGGRVLLPLDVQAHHALMDGVHLGRFFERLEAALAAPEKGLG